MESMAGLMAFVATGCLSMTVRAASSARRVIRPPVAKRLPTEVWFGNKPEIAALCTNDLMTPQRRTVDHYFWLRDDERKDPEVISYLEAENAYTTASLAHTVPLQEELYAQMLSNLKETDENLPYRRGDYFYYTRTVKDMAYSIHCRKRAVSKAQSVTQAADLPEEIVLDENEVAKGLDYCVVEECEPSPSHGLLAYSLDTTGYETYEVRILDLATRQVIDTIPETSGSVEWGADDSTFFYLKMDKEHRPYQLWMHTVGSDVSTDVLMFQEADTKFWMGAGKSNSDDFLCVSSGSPETSECWLMDLRGVKGGGGHRSLVVPTGAAAGYKSTPSGNGDGAPGSISFSPALQCISSRKFGVRYDVEHHGDSLYMVSNQDSAKNCKLMRAPLSYSKNGVLGGLKFADVRAYDEAVQVGDFTPFRDYAVISGRKDGLQQIWRVDMNKPDQWVPITFGGSNGGAPDQCYSVYVAANYNYDTTDVRLGFSSFTEPRQVLSVALATGASEVLWQAEAPNYTPSLYESRRIQATAKDGTQVPISLLYKKTFSPFGADGKPAGPPRPCVLDGYGSYGSCNDPYFSSMKLSLLDRGVVYAIGHIRGGSEMGRQWYEDMGKYLTKTNTFDDFAACAQHLHNTGISAQLNLAGVGRSAGGLLIGATANRSPHLFKALVADVPFVDVMTTMSDPSIPLTTTEWEEWGNPHDPRFFDYMLGYSPMDNVRDGVAYPAMLVTGGLNDPRVAYWEPAKYVAKLRHATQCEDGAPSPVQQPLYLKTDMASGHFSASDRYKYMRETAFEYAFLLDQILDRDE